MNQDQIWKYFDCLWSDIDHDKTFPNVRPILAHYTSIDTLEKILANNEIWLSNLLNMNDIQELQTVLFEGLRAFQANVKVMNACGGQGSSQYAILRQSFENKFNDFFNNHALDNYALCLTEHDPNNRDGLLSMWRGYGGNGHGAAIVFDAAKMKHLDNFNTLVFSKVVYLSDEERSQWIINKMDEFADLLEKRKIPDEYLYLPAIAIFERLKSFSLFTKHKGFNEENEWRIVYQGEHDNSNIFKEMLSYAVGRQGIEPKLKFKIQPIDDLTFDDLSIESIITEIILGPCVSSPLAIQSTQRMLTRLGKNDLAKRVYASTIPFRQ